MEGLEDDEKRVKFRKALELDVCARSVAQQARALYERSLEIRKAQESKKKALEVLRGR